MPSLLDVIVLVVVLISALLAMMRGFVREVLTLVSWAAAAIAAYLLYTLPLPLVRSFLDNATAAIIVSAAAIFLLALIIVSFLSMKIADFVLDSRVGAIDRGLGFLFGAARGVLLVIIALWFFNFLVPEPPEWVAKAQSEPILRDWGEQLVAALPEDIEAWIQSHTRGEGGTTDEAPPPAEDALVDPSDPAYGNDTRGNLDQLILNSDN